MECLLNSLQNKLLLKLLLLTKNAKLVHFSRGGNIVFNDLMKVRKILSEQYNTSFIQGSKVSWTVKGNTYNGIVDKIDDKFAYVISDLDNSMKKIPISKLS